ncbi:MAG: hypothetical protein QOF82_2189 [Frankiales bacterium]|jgi:hypothetical protein|nr:hypothetical protein [Frankiales bacterium]MDX6213102.1 hypothetical protein [Frankiales bacterium]
MKAGVRGKRPFMTSLSDEVDPFISERIIAIRNRFGVDGLRVAADMIALEVAIFAEAAKALAEE